VRTKARPKKKMGDIVDPWKTPKKAKAKNMASVPWGFKKTGGSQDGGNKEKIKKESKHKKRCGWPTILKVADRTEIVKNVKED